MLCDHFVPLDQKFPLLLLDGWELGEERLHLRRFDGLLNLILLVFFLFLFVDLLTFRIDWLRVTSV